MTAATEDVPENAVDAEQRRAGRELILELVFRPLSNMLVPAFVRLRIAPLPVLVANAATGLVAALALARGDLLVAAVLLQLKTLLDNTDGQLARVTGRITLTGRYLDTEADLVVNAALFAALAHVTGKPLLAAAAFVTLALVLAVDFNASELYREQRGIRSSPPLSQGGRLEGALAAIYALVFAPLDRLIRAVSERRFMRLVAADASDARMRDAREAYVDRLWVTVLANLGLTTQLAVLGLCLALGDPEAYLWLTLGGLLVPVVLHARAELRVRAVVRRPRAA